MLFATHAGDSASSSTASMTPPSLPQTASPSSPIVGTAAAAAQQQPPLKQTTAVNRSWSDMNPVTLLGTFGLSSFTYSFLLHPFYLVVARQQCQREEQSARAVVRQVLAQQAALAHACGRGGPALTVGGYQIGGWKGLFRGVGVSTAGTVLSECVYYTVLEVAKERLPFATKESRDFGAGLAADGVSGPLFVPFAVVSQRQMVGDLAHQEHAAFAATAQPHSSPQPQQLPHTQLTKPLSGFATVRHITAHEGPTALLRGTLLSMAAMPISGCWWVLYERLKGRAYGLLAPPTTSPTSSMSGAGIAPTLGDGASGGRASSQWAKLAAMVTSRTDNPAVNALVGGLAGGTITLVLNPLYVVRTRLQVLHIPKSTKDDPTLRPAAPKAPRAVCVARAIYQQSGVWGFARGLRVNMLMGVGGSMLFGVVYEGTKQLADATH